MMETNTVILTAPARLVGNEGRVVVLQHNIFLVVC